MTPQSRALGSSKALFQDALLRWYRRQARPLPWREKPSLYKTVVSEFMLQQTQVKTVLPYFARWMRELPDFEALARAEPDRVLKLWEGLGYYSRARNLHRLAQALLALPEVPRTPGAWLELPGIGPYTAAAVTSIAFGARAACVDGNVVRILARLSADGTAFRDSSGAARILAPLAHELMPEAFAGDHNQAMMELGATVCLPRNPSCLVCPVASFCAAARTGDPQAYPNLAAKSVEQKRVTRVWCERNGALLLHRAPGDAKRLANLHELPTADQAGVPAKRLETGRLIATRTRGITRFRITEEIRAVSASAGRTPADLSWVPVAELDSIALSGPHRRWISEILGARTAPA